MNELIIIAKALEQIANELAEIKYILKYKDNEPRHEDRRSETEHTPTDTHCVITHRSTPYTQEEFRRLTQ